MSIPNLRLLSFMEPSKIGLQAIQKIGYKQVQTETCCPAGNKCHLRMAHNFWGQASALPPFLLQSNLLQRQDLVFFEDFFLETFADGMPIKYVHAERKV